MLTRSSSRSISSKTKSVAAAKSVDSKPKSTTVASRRKTMAPVAPVSKDAKVTRRKSSGVPTEFKSSKGEIARHESSQKREFGTSIGNTTLSPEPSPTAAKELLKELIAAQSPTGVEIKKEPVKSPHRRKSSAGLPTITPVVDAASVTPVVPEPAKEELTRTSTVVEPAAPKVEETKAPATPARAEPKSRKTPSRKTPAKSPAKVTVEPVAEPDVGMASSATEAPAEAWALPRDIRIAIFAPVIVGLLLIATFYSAEIRAAIPEPVIREVARYTEIAQTYTQAWMAASAPYLQSASELAVHYSSVAMQTCQSWWTVASAGISNAISGASAFISAY